MSTVLWDGGCCWLVPHAIAHVRGFVLSSACNNLSQIMCLSGHSNQLCTCANLTSGLPTHHLNVCLFQAKFPANSTSQLTSAAIHDAIVGYSAAVPATLHLLGPAVLHAYKHSGTEGAVIPPSLTLTLPPVLFLCSLRTHQEALLFLSELVMCLIAAVDIRRTPWAYLALHMCPQCSSPV